MKESGNMNRIISKTIIPIGTITRFLSLIGIFVLLYFKEI